MAVKETVKGIVLGSNQLRWRFALWPTKVYNRTSKKDEVIFMKAYTSIYALNRKVPKGKAEWLYQSRFVG